MRCGYRNFQVGERVYLRYPDNSGWGEEGTVIKPTEDTLRGNVLVRWDGGVYRCQLGTAEYRLEHLSGPKRMRFASERGGSSDACPLTYT